MNKKQFLAGIREKLTGLPQNDIDKSIGFYDEMIQDRMEDGLTEEKAVEALGSMEEIAAQILTEISLPKNQNSERKKSKQFKAWEIVLIFLGFPIWIPLLLAALAIILSFYICIWSVIMSFYAANFSIAAAAVFGFIYSFVPLFSGDMHKFAFLFGESLICAGLAVLIFLGLYKVTKTAVIISKQVILKIIKCRGKNNE